MRRGAMTIASMAIVLTACGPSGVARTTTPQPPPPSKVDVRNPFNPIHPFVFGGGDPSKASVQPISRRLATGLTLPDGVRVVPLSSTPQTAAVEILERDPPGNFGNLLAEGQKAVFERFARDRALGPWLIVISALEGEGSALAPPAVDRWRRSAVETYARCGIPATGTNDCKSRFFAQATESQVHQGSGRGTGT